MMRTPGIVLGLVWLATAGPSILSVNGSVSHGASITIQGSAFGVKQQAGPLLWDAVDNIALYESLQDGDIVPITAGYPWAANQSTYGTPVQYSTSRQHRGNRTAHYYSQDHKANVGWPRALGGKNPPATQRRLYVSWWVKQNMSPSAAGGSNKFIRVWDLESGTGTRISWTATHTTYSGGDYSAWGGWTGKANEWNRNEFAVDADAHTIRQYVNGKYLRPSNSSLGGAFDINDFLKDTTCAHVGLQIALIGFDGNTVTGYENMQTDFGEIYADTTPMRVEIGNAPQWSSCTHKEIQIPTHWADGSIQVEINQGSFASQAGAFLFVVNAEGTANEIGYPVEFGKVYSSTLKPYHGLHRRLNDNRATTVNVLGRRLNWEGRSGTSQTASQVRFLIQSEKIQRRVTR